MKVLVTGGSGFIGTHLTRVLLKEGHWVTIVCRRPDRAIAPGDRVRHIAADTRNPGTWQEAIREQDAVVNLAGASIFKRWNETYKKLLRDSRILTTSNVVDAMEDSPGRVPVLISASAVGYYGFTGDEKLSEQAPSGKDFLATLAIDWEREAVRARSFGARVILARFGVVLGRDGGALPMMTLPFRLFVGGPVGDGSQWVSWIHINDLCRAVLFLLEQGAIQGPVNFTAPEPVTNAHFSSAIGRALRRPSFMPAPAFALKLILGEFASVVVKGQRIVPEVLERQGFVFHFPRVKEALADLLH